MTQLTNFLTEPLLLGLIWGILALGVFIAYRVLDIADLSVEGVLPLSAVLSLFLINKGINPLLSLLICVLVGAICGSLVAMMHIYLKIPSLLSGIIMMTGLFSIVVVVSKGNIVLDDTTNSVFNPFILMFRSLSNERSFIAWSNFLGSFVLSTLFMAIVVFLMYWFFGTQLGLAIRATGKNKMMSRAQGINTNKMEIIGLSLSSALVALSGALLAQYQGYASSTIGKGTIVIGLAIIFLGEAIFGRKTFKTQLVSIIIGGFLYWYIIDAILLIPNFDSNLLYLVQAILIVLILVVPMLVNKFKRHQNVKNIRRENDAKN
jgi:putative tryptophan/tyrosine transport system permease protein